MLFPDIILGSKSPRRAALLNAMHIPFKVQKLEVEEVVPDNMPAREVALYLSELKNKAYRDAFPDQVILTADTVVIYHDQILGKPKDLQEAMETLHMLSGEKHSVKSGFCISNKDRIVADDAETTVKFKNLTKDEIKFYVETFQPLDKAGSYGIQEWIGLIGIDWVDGSYENVVGLPTQKVYHALTQIFS